MTIALDEAATRAIWQPALLALMTWREARGAGPVAMAAVAHTAVTRGRLHPGWWGHDIEGAIGLKWQYSSMAAPGDPQLILWPHSYDLSFQAALSIVQGVLDGTEPNPAPEADSYYDDSIAAPAWTAKATFITKIDRLNFYRVRTHT